MNQSSNGCLKDVLGSNWKEKKLNRQRLLRHRGNSSLVSKPREITISFSDTDKPTLELFKLSPPTNSNLIFWLASSHVSHWVLSNSLWPLCPWNYPGKDTGMGNHSLLQGVFLTQNQKPGLLHCSQILYCHITCKVWKKQKSWRNCSHLVKRLYKRYLTPWKDSIKLKPCCQ